MSGRTLPAGLLVPVLLVLLLSAMAASIFIGRSITAGETIAVILDRIPGLRDLIPYTVPSVIAVNTMNLALPRIILAAIVGAGLAWSGAVFQALFRNPLADPYFLGVSAGASFGSTLAIVLGAGTGFGLSVWIGFGLSSLSAFACALVAVFAVYLIARRRGRLPLAHLVLAGIAVSAVLTALVSGLTLLASAGFERIMFAVMGSFARATWEKAGLTLALMLPAMAASLFCARDLNLILLGEEQAFGLGVDVEKRKRLLLAAASLLGAAAVSAAGIIWFVGLIIPHLMRFLTGPDNRRLLPVSGLAGAILLVAADALSRVLIPPYELPIGILTALCGAPFFIYLILKNKKTGTGWV
jgi:iron complex transport system permease protein